MKIFDFSLEKLPTSLSDSDWEKQIVDFINEWNSDTEEIIAKTSGSTEEPKEISLPKEAMRMSTKMTASFFNLKKGDTALLCLPVHYIAGKMMLVRAMELGLKLFITEPKTRIDLHDFPKLDFVPMTPMQVEKSFDSLNNVRTLLIGGAPLSDELRAQLLKLPIRCYESYGMTETITHIALREISEKYFRALNGVNFRTDERGCLVIQTPYFQQEIITNDVVELKNNREFNWLGRIDNVINSGGVKLFPEEIEKKIKPFVQEELIVTSISDPLLGEKLVCVIENPKFDKAHYKEMLGKAGLKKIQTPKEIYFLESFPKTNSGKIIRKEIRKQISSS